MLSRMAMIASGVTVFSGTAYVVGIVAAPAPTYTVSHEQRLSTFEDIAPVYERKTQKQEFYLGIGRLRRRLLAEHASGRVLEVGCGTGVNVGLYPAFRCDEVILSDRATAMTDISARKILTRLGYDAYIYPALLEDEAAPKHLDQKERSQQQKQSQRDHLERLRLKQQRESNWLQGGSGILAEEKAAEELKAAADAREENKDAYLRDTPPPNAVGGSGHKCDHDHGGSGRLVSKIADLTAEGKAALAARASDIAARARFRVQREKEAVVISKKHVVTNTTLSANAVPTSDPTSPLAKEPLTQQQAGVYLPHTAATAENSQLAKEKRLYSIANYPAEHLPYPSNSFDTVVDVFGLCSFEDPVAALGELSRVCKPQGKILLLEHGRGKYEKLNWYLDKWAPRHAASWGCWWNRDIRRAVRTAGMTILHKEEKHMGTTLMIVAAPYKTREEMLQVGRRI